MKEMMENGVMTLPLRGRIDAENAPEQERLIREKIAEHGPSGLILDCSELQYISSAGLRVLLRLKRTVPDLKLVNVSGEIYEILEMTGFLEILNVSRAYRTISLKGAKMIGQGASGIVYRLDPETIVKVYRNRDSLQEIFRERELAKRAFVLGIPTAISYGVVRLEEGGYGTVFELLEAESYAELLQSGKKSVDELAVMSTALLKQIHAIRGGAEIPPVKKEAISWVKALKGYLPEDAYEKLDGMLEALPEDDHLIHGDYHIKNLMWQQGETLLIDMDSLSCGQSVFELASIYNAYCAFPETNPESSRKFLGIPLDSARELWERSFYHYMEDESEAARARMYKQVQLISYMRIMSRRIRRGGQNTEDGRKEIAYCREKLVELLKQVDQLT